VSKFQIQNFKIKNKSNFKLGFKLKIKKIFLKILFLKKSKIFKIFKKNCNVFAINFFSKNHISVLVLTTPINFWSIGR
jgi:hypothetical protein